MANHRPPLELVAAASIASTEIPRSPSGPVIAASPMMSRPGTMLLASRMTPVVPRTGPLVRRLTWVPVAKISSAMRGMALSLNSAVVKRPKSSAAGETVAGVGDRTRGWGDATLAALSRYVSYVQNVLSTHYMDRMWWSNSLRTKRFTPDPGLSAQGFLGMKTGPILAVLGAEHHDCAHPTPQKVTSTDTHDPRVVE